MNAPLKKRTVTKADKPKVSNDKFRPGELRDIVLSSIGLAILLGGTFLVTPNFPIIYSLFAGLIKDMTRKDIPKKKIKRNARTTLTIYTNLLDEGFCVGCITCSVCSIL